MMTVETNVQSATDRGGTRKIDPITELQDSIDGLTLAMFEALRGLRDAVAPLGVLEPNSASPAATTANTSLPTEAEDDTALVQRLAGKVLEHSHKIDEQVDALVEKWSTSRTTQLQRVESLLQANVAASRRLESLYQQAALRRQLCRQLIRQNTAQAMGIEDDNLDA